MFFEATFGFGPEVSSKSQEPFEILQCFEWRPLLVRRRCIDYAKWKEYKVFKLQNLKALCRFAWIFELQTSGLRFKILLQEFSKHYKSLFGQNPLLDVILTWLLVDFTPKSVRECHSIKEWIESWRIRRQSFVIWRTNSVLRSQSGIMQPSRNLKSKD